MGKGHLLSEQCFYNSFRFQVIGKDKKRGTEYSMRQGEGGPGGDDECVKTQKCLHGGWGGAYAFHENQYFKSN